MTTLFLNPGKPAKRPSTNRFVFNFLTLFLLSFISIHLSAQIPSTFCDGNPSDLANFTTTYPIHGYVKDVANAASNLDDQYTIGSKDGSPISTGTSGTGKAIGWSLGNANSKGDITNAGAALTGTNNCILRFFGDRTSNSGDASIGFWFYVSPVSTNANGTFSGTHTNGDLLILSDFTGGGTTPTVSVYLWQNGAPVLQTANASNYCADVNHTTYPVPAGFTYTASDGSTSYAPNLFFEGAINLCSLNIASCFSSFLLETRNSQSITASLQDFALGSFNATPPTPAATVVQPTCAVATGTVNVTNPVSGYTYTLTGTSPVSAAVTSTTGTFNNVAAGTYSLTASQGTCTSGASQVIVNAQPATPSVPTLAQVNPTCTVATGTITITSSTTGLTFSFDGGAYAAYPSGGYTGLAANSSHTLTAKNSAGCISGPATAIIGSRPVSPDRPVVTIQEATLCGTLTAPTLTVSCPVSGATYTLTQTGIAGSQTRLYNGTGTVVFTVQAGHSFSITATSSDGCVSAATDCNNYTTNSCPAAKPAQAIATNSVKSKTSVLAAPNPFNDRVRFTFKSAVSGQGSLELYNMLGQKVKTVYQGFVEKGKDQTIEYSVPNAQRTNLIYMFRVGNERISGKLIGLK